MQLLQRRLDIRDTFQKENSIRKGRNEKWAHFFMDALLIKVIIGCLMFIRVGQNFIVCN